MTLKQSFSLLKMGPDDMQPTMEKSSSGKGELDALAENIKQHGYRSAADFMQWDVDYKSLHTASQMPDTTSHECRYSAYHAPQQILISECLRQETYKAALDTGHKPFGDIGTTIPSSISQQWRAASYHPAISAKRLRQGQLTGPDGRYIVPISKGGEPLALENLQSLCNPATT